MLNFPPPSRPPLAQVTTVASLVGPTISGRHVGTHNFVLAQLYRWGFEHPERAPKAPIIAAAVWHPRPHALSPTGRRGSSAGAGVGTAAASAPAPVVAGMAVPATPKPGAAPTAAPGWKIRSADCDVIITAVAEAASSGVVYLASPHEWHLSSSSSSSSAVRAARSGGGIVDLSETEEQAAIQLILNAAAHKLVEALRGHPSTELIGGHGFVTDEQGTVARSSGIGFLSADFMTNDAVTSSAGGPASTTVLLHSHYKAHDSHASVLGMFGGAMVEVDVTAGGSSGGGGLPPLHPATRGKSDDKEAAARPPAASAGGDGGVVTVGEVDITSPKLTASARLSSDAGGSGGGAGVDGGFPAAEDRIESQVSAFMHTGRDGGDGGSHSPVGIPSSSSDPATVSVLLGGLGGTAVPTVTNHMDMYTASLPRTLVIHPGECGKGMEVHRFVGPESVATTVARAYCEAAGREPTATVRYKHTVAKTLQVYEFAHPRHMATGAVADSLSRLTGLHANGGGEVGEGGPDKDASAAASDLVAAARTGAELRLAQALDRAAKARAVGIRFRHATLEDFKTISTDFAGFYKEKYEEELPPEQAAARAAELKASIEANEYFLLEAPPSWLTEATGVADKLTAEEKAREKRVARALHTHGGPGGGGGSAAGSGIMGMSSTPAPAAPASAPPSPAAPAPAPAAAATAVVSAGSVEGPAGSDSSSTGSGSQVVSGGGKLRSKSIEFLEENTRSDRMVVVGMACIRGRHPMGARIAEMFVKESYRRKGFALLILNMLTELVCDMEDVPSLCLFADAANEATAQLMAKAGFMARERIAMVDIHADGRVRACGPGGRGSCAVM